MAKQFKIYGITPTAPTFIIRVLIEQKFDAKEVHVNQSLIKVIQLQATSEILETKYGPEVITRIDYLTANGIFNADELSGVGIAAKEDEFTYIDLNFNTTEGSNTASLIIPKSARSIQEPIKSKYLSMILDYFAPERYAIEVKIEDIKPFLQGIFLQMSESSKLHTLVEAK